MMRLKAVIGLFIIILIGLWGSSNAGGLAEIEVGVGPNFGYLAYDDPPEIWDVGWAIGFAGGISFEIILSNRLFLVPRARFTDLNNNVQFNPDPRVSFQASL
jgi:hypothetical protein